MDIKKSEAYKQLVRDMQKKYPIYQGNSSKEAKVDLWAPCDVNGEMICHEINLYSYWQGFKYAEKTPKIKYLLVAQDTGNVLFPDSSHG